MVENRLEAVEKSPILQKGPEHYARVLEHGGDGLVRTAALAAPSAGRPTLSARRSSTARKYAGAFLQRFAFHSRSRHDPLLAAVATLKVFYAD